MSLKVKFKFKFKFMEEELFRIFIFTDIQTFNNDLKRALSDVSCFIRCFVLYWYCFVNRIWWYSIWWLNRYCRGNTGIVLSNWNGPVGSSCSIMAQGDANIWWAGFSEYGRCFIWINGKTNYTLEKNRVTCKTMPAFSSSNNNTNHDSGKYSESKNFNSEHNENNNSRSDSNNKWITKEIHRQSSKEQQQYTIQPTTLIKIGTTTTNNYSKRNSNEDHIRITKWEIDVPWHFTMVATSWFHLELLPHVMTGVPALWTYPL